MNKNSIIKFVAVLSLGMLVVSLPGLASAQSTGASDSSAAGAPSSGSTDSSAGGASSAGSTASSAGSPPSSGGSDSSAGSVPSSGGSASSAGSGTSNSAPSSGGSTSSADDSAPSSGSSTSSAGGSSGTSGSGSGGGLGTVTTTTTVGGSGGVYSYGGLSAGGFAPGAGSIPVEASTASVTPVAISVPVTIVASNSSPCPLITSFMKLGAANDPAQVTRLQQFLNNTQGAGLQVTGIFDQSTEDAVKAFQKEYLTDVMGPWGATRASGIVYITTAKKINEIVCSMPLSLDASELSTIAAYQSNVAGAAIAGNDQSGSSMTVGVTAAPSMTASANVDATNTMIGPVLSQSSTTSNTAAASNSVSSRFWNFFKNLF